MNGSSKDKPIILVDQSSEIIDRIFSETTSFANTCPATDTSCHRLNKYMTDCNMPVVSSQYWNVIHGNTPEEIRQDTEGLQTMHVLARNMAWLLKCIQAGRKAGITFPEHGPHTMTNFIR